MSTTLRSTASPWVSKERKAMRDKLPAMAEALKGLPQRQADVIILTYYEELPAVKAAALMGITASEAVTLRREAEAALLRALAGTE